MVLTVVVVFVVEPPLTTRHTPPHGLSRGRAVCVKGGSHASNALSLLVVDILRRKWPQFSAMIVPRKRRSLVQNLVNVTPECYAPELGLEVQKAAVFLGFCADLSMCQFAKLVCWQ